MDPYDQDEWFARRTCRPCLAKARKCLERKLAAATKAPAKAVVKAMAAAAKAAKIGGQGGGQGRQDWAKECQGAQVVGLSVRLPPTSHRRVASLRPYVLMA